MVDVLNSSKDFSKLVLKTRKSKQMEFLQMKANNVMKYFMSQKILLLDRLDTLEGSLQKMLEETIATRSNEFDAHKQSIDVLNRKLEKLEERMLLHDGIVSDNSNNQQNISKSMDLQNKLQNLVSEYAELNNTINNHTVEEVNIELVSEGELKFKLTGLPSGESVASQYACNCNSLQVETCNISLEECRYHCYMANKGKSLGQPNISSKSIKNMFTNYEIQRNMNNKPDKNQPTSLVQNNDSPPASEQQANYGFSFGNQLKDDKPVFKSQENPSEFGRPAVFGNEQSSGNLQQVSFRGNQQTEIENHVGSLPSQGRGVFTTQPSQHISGFGGQPPQSSGLFGGQPPQSSGLFGGQPPQSSGLFGGQPSQGSGLFGGQPSQGPGVFGQTSQSSGSFGGQPSQGTGVFGGQPSQGPGVFGGQPSQGSGLFGGQPSQGSGLFGGQPSQGSGLFGGQPPQGPGVFGGQPSQGPGVFVQTSQSSGSFGGQPSQGTVVFGGQPSQGPGVFGGQPSQGSGLFGGQPSQGSGLFGGQPPQGPGVFGGQPSQGSGLFGGQSSQGPGVFGGQPSQGSGLFGGQPSQGSGLFGGQPSQGPGVFGGQTSQGSGLFGGQPSQGSGLFGGQPSQGSGLFGGQTSQGSGLFGGQPSQGSGLFGEQPSQCSGLFGGHPPQSSGLFGGQPSQGPGVFGGQPSQGTGVFGGQPSQGTGVLGGQAAQGTGVFGGQAAQGTGVFGGQASSSGVGLGSQSAIIGPSAFGNAFKTSSGTQGFGNQQSMLLGNQQISVTSTIGNEPASGFSFGGQPTIGPSKFVSVSKTSSDAQKADITQYSTNTSPFGNQTSVTSTIGNKPASGFSFGGQPTIGPSKFGSFPKTSSDSTNASPFGNQPTSVTSTIGNEPTSGFSFGGQPTIGPSKFVSVSKTSSDAQKADITQYSTNTSPFGNQTSVTSTIGKKPASGFSFGGQPTIGPSKFGSFPKTSSDSTNASPFGNQPTSVTSTIGNKPASGFSFGGQPTFGPAKFGSFSRTSSDSQKVETQYSTNTDLVTTGSKRSSNVSPVENVLGHTEQDTGLSFENLSMSGTSVFGCSSKTSIGDSQFGIKSTSVTSNQGFGLIGSHSDSSPSAGSSVNSPFENKPGTSGCLMKQEVSSTATSGNNTSIGTTSVFGRQKSISAGKASCEASSVTGNQQAFESTSTQVVEVAKRIIKLNPTEVPSIKKEVEEDEGKNEQTFKVEEENI
ncbi:uncharacterized protein [Antedon mediterranea]